MFMSDEEESYESKIMSSIAKKAESEVEEIKVDDEEEAFERKETAKDFMQDEIMIMQIRNYDLQNDENILSSYRNDQTRNFLVPKV